MGPEIGRELESEELMPERRAGGWMLGSEGVLGQPAAASVHLEWRRLRG